MIMCSYEFEVASLHDSVALCRSNLPITLCMFLKKNKPCLLVWNMTCNCCLGSCLLIAELASDNDSLHVSNSRAKPTRWVICSAKILPVHYDKPMRCADPSRSQRQFAMRK